MIIPLDSKGYTVAGWFGVALMAAVVVWLAWQGVWLGFAISLLFAVASAAFMCLRRRLPALLDLLFVIAALANGAGWVWELYSPIFGYDEVVHAYTTFAASLSFGFAMYYAEREYFRPVVFGLAIVTFGIAAGAIWEMFEWLIINVKDPVPDLMVDTIGAIVAGVFGARVLKVQLRGGRNIGTGRTNQ